MSEHREEEAQVIESPDCVDIAPPSDKYTIRQPFAYLESKWPRSSLIILNQSLRELDLETIWKNTNLHVCADGGANHLFDYFDNERQRKNHIPDYITGDFDSIRDEVMDYYNTNGSIIIKQQSQYATDFNKAILIASIYYHSNAARAEITENVANLDDNKSLVELSSRLARLIKDKVNQDRVKSIVDTETPTIEGTKNTENHPEKSNTADSISTDKIINYIVGGIGGRFDQTIASIHQLYVLNESDPHIELVFITKNDVILLLQKGINYLQYEDKSTWSCAEKVPVCGLLPLGSSLVILNTSGLKYDVKNWESGMLSNVSSSNGLSGNTGVIIETSGPIVVNIVHGSG